MIKLGISYRHKRTGNRYLTLDSVQMKHPVSGEWIAAVHYKDWSYSARYVREALDFEDKFEPWFQYDVAG